MKTTIIGMGRFGQCLAQCLTDILDLNYIDPQARDVPWPRIDWVDLASSTTVFLCMPINQMRTCLKTLSPHLNPKATVIDTCSVKIKPCQWMETTLPNSTQLIATHPLFGPDSIQSVHTIIVHPLRCTDHHFEHWLKQLRSINLEPKRMSPDEHDRTIGVTQSLTHYVGRLLGGITRPTTALQTLGYKKLCDVQHQTCFDDWQLFLDIIRFNPYNHTLIEAIDQQQRILYNALHTQEEPHGN